MSATKTSHVPITQHGNIRSHHIFARMYFARENDFGDCGLLEGHEGVMKGGLDPRNPKPKVKNPIIYFFIPEIWTYAVTGALNFINEQSAQGQILFSFYDGKAERGSPNFFFTHLPSPKSKICISQI